MARVGYYIISAEQAAVINELKTTPGLSLNVDVIVLGNLYCVEDWDAVIEALNTVVWEDGEVSDTEGEWLDTMSDFQNYMYWSTEAHSWVN